MVLAPDKNTRHYFRMRLKGLRESEQMSQAALAERLGASQSAVSRWEKSGQLPEIETIEHISEVFGVSVAYLLSSNEVADVPIIGTICPSNYMPITFGGDVNDEDMRTVSLGMTAPVPQHCFGMDLDTNEMSDYYPRGCTIICSPVTDMKRGIETGDDVVVRRVYSEGRARIFLRRARVTEDGVYFEATNPTKKTEQLAKSSRRPISDVEAIGIVVSALIVPEKFRDKNL